jgi:hypothetical protein
MIGVFLIDEDGPVLAAMPGQIPLAVTIDIESPYHAPAFNRRLPDGGVDGLPSPRDVTRETHVDRKQACRHFLFLRRRSARPSERGKTWARMDHPSSSFLVVFLTLKSMMVTV